MILEIIGSVRSLFPFIKEAFLWRDGAEEGKPITKMNLWKRKVATYLMTISLALNYYAGHKLYKMAQEVVHLRKEVATLHEKISNLNTELKDFKDQKSIEEDKVKENNLRLLKISERGKTSNTKH